MYKKMIIYNDLSHRNYKKINLNITLACCMCRILIFSSNGSKSIGNEETIFYRLPFRFKKKLTLFLIRQISYKYSQSVLES